MPAHSFQTPVSRPGRCQSGPTLLGGAAIKNGHSILVTMSVDRPNRTLIPQHIRQETMEAKGYKVLIEQAHDADRKKREPKSRRR
jgi:hypothetical protein